MHTHTHTEPAADASRPQSQPNPARARRQRDTAAARARRAREASSLSAKLGDTRQPVAFARDAEARHSLSVNPNTGKRHASKAGPNLHADRIGAQRERLTLNTGKRARGQTARTPHVATTWARIPALPPAISRRPLKP